MSDNIDKKMALAIGAVGAVAMSALALSYYFKSKAPAAETSAEPAAPVQAAAEESKEESKSA